MSLPGWNQPGCLKTVTSEERAELLDVAEAEGVLMTRERQHPFPCPMPGCTSTRSYRYTEPEDESLDRWFCYCGYAEGAPAP